VLEHGQVDPATSTTAGLDLQPGMALPQFGQQPVQRLYVPVGAGPSVGWWPASTRGRLWSHLR
jgi:hypothetical protein